MAIPYGMTTSLLAEREGFEPSEPLRAHLFSRQASSTTPAPLRTECLFYQINRECRRVFSGRTGQAHLAEG